MLLTEVDRLRAESYRLRDEARALDVQATKAMSEALAAIPDGVILEYVFFPPSDPDGYAVVRTGTGWVEVGSETPVHQEWVETYWARGSLRIREEGHRG